MSAAMGLNIIPSIYIIVSIPLHIVLASRKISRKKICGNDYDSIMLYVYRIVGNF